MFYYVVETDGFDDVVPTVPKNLKFPGSNVKRTLRSRPDGLKETRRQQPEGWGTLA